MKWLICIVMLLQIMGPGEASAYHLPAPAGAVVLTVEGQIKNCNAGLETRLDLAMIESLPRQQVTTENPWMEGMATYEGVLLRDLLDFVEANGTTLKIVAPNDYSAELTVADVKSIDVILAYKRDGKYMPVREKGPLFVVFPFSQQPSLAVEQRFAQSVWQVSRITVK